MVEEGVVIAAFSQRTVMLRAFATLKTQTPRRARGLFGGQAGELAAAVSRLGKALGGAAGALVERGLGATETAFRTITAAEAAFTLRTVAEAGAITEARTGVTGSALAERTGVALGAVAKAGTIAAEAGTRIAVAATEAAFTRGTVAEGTIALVAAFALGTITEAGAVAERTCRAVAERTIALVAAFARCAVAVALVTTFTRLELATRGAVTRGERTTFTRCAVTVALVAAAFMARTTETTRTLAERLAAARAPLPPADGRGVRFGSRPAITSGVIDWPM